jgi:hypothetical protein
MQGEEFLTFIKHFSKHTKPTKDNKYLLLLENHENHLYLPTMNFCRENGIITFAVSSPLLSPPAASRCRCVWPIQMFCQLSYGFVDGKPSGNTNDHLQLPRKQLFLCLKLQRLRTSYQDFLLLEFGHLIRIYLNTQIHPLVR